MRESPGSLFDRAARNRRRDDEEHIFPILRDEGCCEGSLVSGATATSKSSLVSEHALGDDKVHSQCHSAMDDSLRRRLRICGGRTDRAGRGLCGLRLVAPRASRRGRQEYKRIHYAPLTCYSSTRTDSVGRAAGLNTASARRDTRLTWRQMLDHPRRATPEDVASDGCRPLHARRVAPHAQAGRILRRFILSCHETAGLTTSCWHGVWCGWYEKKGRARGIGRCVCACALRHLRPLTSIGRRVEHSAFVCCVLRVSLSALPRLRGLLRLLRGFLAERSNDDSSTT